MPRLSSVAGRRSTPVRERDSLDKSSETMCRLFPEPTTHSLRIRKTYVLWDISGFSIHEDFHPCSIREQIESGIKKEGYYGELSLWVYGAKNAWSTELDSIFWDSGFETQQYKGGISTRLHMLVADFLAMLFVLNYPSNVLLLSENKEEVERDPKFARLRKILEDNSFFVVSAHPETLIDSEAD
uniref:NYN domain-containing protein n=1 Tax=Noccaea caerulescens TaxID=107243 RepID=A0A1J3IMQ7_NOCCA